jgi:hypothetical protein
MWLLDANMDVHLVSVLTGCKISCDTAGKRNQNVILQNALVQAESNVVRCSGQR